MDVIEPCLVWVEGRRYRFFESNIWSCKDIVCASSNEDPCTEKFSNFDIQEYDDSDTPECDDYSSKEFDDSDTQEFNNSNAKEFDDFDTQKYDDLDSQELDDIKEEKPPDIHVTPLHGSEFVHTFAIDTRYFPIIVGQNGDVKKKLELNTQTLVTIPFRNMGEEIVIKGPSEEAVISARRQIEEIIENFTGDLRPCTGPSRPTDAREFVDSNTQKSNDIKEEQSLENIEVVPMSNRSGFTHTFAINERFFPIIVGRKGCLKMKLETDTATDIKIPYPHEGNKVVIRGSTKEAVISARRRIDGIIDNFRGYLGTYRGSKGLLDAQKFGDSKTQKFNDCNTQKSNDTKEEEPSDKIDVVSTGTSKYTHTFEFEKRFRPVILGRGGTVIQQLESDTKSSIFVPKYHEDNKITIKGSSKEAVILARRKINSLINDYIGNFRSNNGSSGTSEARVESSSGPLKEKIASSGSLLKAKIESPSGPLEEKIASSGSLLEAKIESPSGPSEKKVTNSGYPVDRMIKNSDRPSVFPVKRPFTHFISIPMTSETITSNCVKFKNLLLGASGNVDRGVREEIFCKPEKMHISLGMLSLLNDNAIKAAADNLEECKKKIITPFLDKMGAIKIRVRGLESLSWEPGDINVLYCRVSTENNALQKLSDKIVEFFILTGFMETPRKKWKSHITLMNVKFDKKCPQKKFYGKNILRDHEDYFFGETELSTILISERGNYSEDGYYATRAKIDIP